MMQRLERRLEALETTVSDTSVKLIERRILTHEDVANGRPGRLVTAHLIGDREAAETLRRNDGESDAEFQDRLTAAYERVHGEPYDPPTSAREKLSRLLSQRSRHDGKSDAAA